MNTTHEDKPLTLEEIRSQRLAAMRKDVGEASTAVWFDEKLGSRLSETERPDTGLKNFLRHPDRETLETLAKTNPALAKQLRDEHIGRVASQFAESTKSWFATDSNYGLLIQDLAKVTIGKTRLSDEEAEDAIAEAGEFTLENLRASFRRLKAAGRLQVKPGATKALSRLEQRQVAATITTAGEGEAINEYFRFASGGTLPALTSARDLLASHPNLCRAAACFVFEHSRPAFVDSEAWRHFLDEHVRGRASAIVTVQWLDTIWAAFVSKQGQEIARSPLPIPQARPVTRPEELTDAELQAAMGDLRAQARSLRGGSLGSLQ